MCVPDEPFDASGLSPLGWGWAVDAHQLYMWDITADAASATVRSVCRVGFVTANVPLCVDFMLARPFLFPQVHPVPLVSHIQRTMVANPHLVHVFSLPPGSGALSCLVADPSGTLSCYPEASESSPWCSHTVDLSAGDTITCVSLLPHTNVRCGGYTLLCLVLLEHHTCVVVAVWCSFVRVCLHCCVVVLIVVIVAVVFFERC